MKTTLIALILTALLAAPIISAKPFDVQPARSSSLSSPRLTSSDRLMKMDDRMVIIRNGRAIPMTSEVVFANGSRVTLDGLLISKSGGRQKLPDCAVLTLEGRRVQDHVSRVVMIDGQMMVMRDGVTRRMEMSTSLGGGRTVTQDGYLVERGGNRREIPEGAMLAISAERAVPSLDAAKQNLGAAR